MKAGLPSAALAASVTGYNQGAQSGKDEFGRRSRKAFQPILTPPFFAVPVYALTRKSMGGIQVDSSCRVLTEQREVVPGLYASGEATGFGGVNGKQSLEGTFVGTAILMGRVAARSMAGRSEPKSKPQAPGLVHEALLLPKSDVSSAVSCLSCHNLPLLTAAARPGYRHFERSHAIVVERKMSCITCHAEMTPFRPEAHQINKMVQVESCINCHSPPR